MKKENEETVAADGEMPTPPESPAAAKKQRKSPVKKSKSPAKSAKEVNDDEPPVETEQVSPAAPGGNEEVAASPKGTPKATPKGTPKGTPKSKKVLPEPSNIGLSNEAI